ncbi:MAG: cytosine permease [Steroidobacteraceae bacterium]
MSVTTANESQADSLRPTGEARVFTGLSYVLMWWSSLIVIQAFALGQGFLPPIGQLNLAQALTVMVIAVVLFVVMFSLNGQAGLKYGIPYSIQARMGFGLRGSTIVEFLRAAPAIVWYGIGTWIAALSLDGILQALTGFTAPAAKYVYFLALQALQTALAWRGIRTMKWFNAVSSVVIAAVMIYMMSDIIGTYGFTIQESWRAAGSWGTPFWVALAGAIGVLATVMLNISDMTRHLQKSQAANWFGHLFGVLPPWFFMLSLGIIAGAALGIWDPVQALIKLSPNPMVMILLLAFVLLAQITTNLTINVLPPALIFMNTFKLKWHSGVLVTGFLGTLSMPWLIMANQQAFFGFILYYSALFGPVLGVMLADYFVIRQRRLAVDTLYVEGAASPYWYRGGFNPAGVIAIFLPGIITMIWFLSTSWLLGVPAGFILYLLLYRLTTRA